MSYIQPLVGLSDIKFDADLHKSEIDHDFFDNPCANASAKFHENGPCKENSSDDAINTTNPEDRSQINFVGSIEKVPMEDDFNAIPSQHQHQHQHQRQLRAGEYGHGRFQLSNQNGNFCLSLDMSECRDAIPRSEQPNLIFSQSSRSHHIFSTGKLLECLTQDDEIVDSGPHSSFFDQYLPKDQISEGSSGESGIVAHDAPSDEHAPASQTRKKLFDLSSSGSGSDSNSEISDESLDTEDEEFVELLEKYYDYIDLEDSGSDITEVSPMSSLAESPHPSFTDRGAGVGRTDAVDADADSTPVVDGRNSDPDAAMLSQKFKNHPVIANRALNKLACTHQMLQSKKPLPPLIINTIEDPTTIPPDQISPALATTLNQLSNNRNLERRCKSSSNPQGSAAGSSSLLMKYDNEGGSDTSNGHEKENDVEIKTKSGNGKGKGKMWAQMSSNQSQSTASISMCNSASASFQGGNADSATTSTSTSTSTSTGQKHKRYDRESKILLRKLLDEGKGGHAKGYLHNRHNGHHSHNQPQPLKASATIIRQRQQRRIEHENAILMRRLQTVKPSKEIVDAFKIKN